MANHEMMTEHTHINAPVIRPAFLTKPEAPKVAIPSIPERKLVVVANATPVKNLGEGKVAKGAGGLVTALNSVEPAAWVGSIHEKDIPDDERGGLEEAMRSYSEAANYTIAGVRLSAEEHEQYYTQIANELLWPLFHNAPEMRDEIPDMENAWNTYREVNKKFARTTIETSTPNDMIWVQDYHLLNVAKEMRKERPNQSINFFLHIPFPTPKNMNQMPDNMAVEMLTGLLAHNLVGFHMPEYVTNFIDCVNSYKERGLMDVEFIQNNGETMIKSGNHTARLGAFPISIDYDAFANPQEEEHVQKHTKKIAERRGDRVNIFNGGRNDWTKSFADGLRAYKYMLDENPHLRGEVNYTLLSVPTRTDIPKYKATHNEVMGLVEEINNEYPGAVELLGKNMPPSELIAHYRMARMAAIAPRVDGMNLMAKEYIAAGPDDGVLIIGKGAGAAKDLNAAHDLDADHHALLIDDPRKYEEAAFQMLKGLDMKPEERKYHMAGLKRAVAENNVFTWVSKFLKATE